jgi:hypothetical protein
MMTLATIISSLAVSAAIIVFLKAPMESHPQVHHRQHFR